MPPIRRLRSRKPPRPCVEDELESLSRELGGLSLLGEKPGWEGACERGAVDQLPILLDIEKPFVDTTPSSSQPPSLVSESSQESFGPPTPPEPEVLPVTSPYKGSQLPPVQPYSAGFPFGHSSLVNVPRPKQQNYADNERANSSHYGSRQGQTCATSSSARSAPHNSRYEDPINQTKKVFPQSIMSPRKQTVAELLEEKLRLRREQQSSPPHSDTRYDERLSPRITPERPIRPKMHIDLTSLPLVNPRPSSNSPNLESPAVQYISEPSPPSSPYRSIVSRPTPGYEKRKPSPTVAALPPKQGYKQDYFSQAKSPVKKLRHSSQSPPRSGDSATGGFNKRAVTFVEPRSPRNKPVQPVEFHRQDSPSSRPLRPESPPKRTSAQPVDVSSLVLRPCPRATPAAGYQDWYTMSGLTHLNICPSCMNQIGSSRFRDYFVPSLPNLRAKIHCSFSEPWTRLAWIQTLKKGYNNLDMLYEITRPSRIECPGRKLSAQNWYRVIDHQTGMNVPRFAACAACVRNLQLLMPPLRQSFSCQPTVQEKLCDFAIDSPRFVQYLDLLDSAANHCEYNRLWSPEIDRFIDYVERKCSLRDCRRDRLVLGTWHYIPNLPEFTVCEDCYDDVVRPLGVVHKPIAKMMANPPRLLPGSGPNRCREASCQLYSPRMRAQFRDAVLDDDYRGLESVALRRFDAEQRFREKEERLLLIEETNRGSSWQEEWHRNREEWKKHE
ncbi:uncharacterized protein TRUGW13939_05603 [Talaromyces rugulosus]|uniref:Uncharacterized protein n=1 Tax=Talaromyces rugulosus TaxID=121627 RepID=A0A7H8QWP4_TALRU|nr:uncharacterized protein TRUGW13939_05603 [Talaromyces rugulosus]QKX58479.1 hypothetical protein TRUGW13939_05603 [Talaromyces rugulosus]